MNHFFKNLVHEKLIVSWASILDWLLSEHRFAKENGWTKDLVNRFTKRIKKLPHIGSDNFVYDSIKNLHFPTKSTQDNSIKLLIGKKVSIGRDLVRHIRNGIAHGNCTLKKIKGTLYIEILDYNSKGTQTAYIFLPIEYISMICEIYFEIEKGASFSKNSLSKSA